MMRRLIRVVFVGAAAVAMTACCVLPPWGPGPGPGHSHGGRGGGGPGYSN